MFLASMLPVENNYGDLPYCAWNIPSHYINYGEPKVQEFHNT